MFRLHSTAFFLLAIFFKIVVLTENSLLCEFNPQDKQTIEKIISKKKKISTSKCLLTTSEFDK